MRGALTMLAAAGLYIAVCAAPASAEGTAEAFAQSLIDGGFAILRDPGADEPARVSRFHDHLVQHIDARKAALFALGPYRRGAPDGVVEAFVAAFADYATAIYETQLHQYKSARVHVTGSIANRPDDVTVMAVAEGAGLREPLRIAFRLAAAGDTYKLVDAQVAGIWLSIEQRDQFASALARSHGDIVSLTASLRDRALRIRAPKS